MYDWYGCLIQSLPTWVGAYKAVLQEVGIIKSQIDIMSCLGNWEAAAILGHPDPEKANQKIVSYVHNHIKDAELYPSVCEVIDALKNQVGLKLFIVTATKRHLAEATRAFQQLAQYIDFAVFAEDVTNHKPHPEAINLILEKFGIHNEEVLVVGDSANDVLAAKNAGIDSAWFAPTSNETFHQYDKIASLQPTHRIKDHMDLLASYKKTAQAS